MSKLYVRLYTGFFTHRKTLRLRATLGNDAYWIPPRIWAYAVENQPDGDFSKYTPEEIASLIGYNGDALSMLQALLKAGFMDDAPLRIHDWCEHNGYHKTYSERAKKAAVARWAKPLTPAPTPNKDKDKDKEREASIAPSNASSIPPVLKMSERISMEKELSRVTGEIRHMGQLSDYESGSKKWARLVELLKRQKEICKALGVVA
jgi:hypothetical protein